MNAKEELLKIVKNTDDILCAHIYTSGEYNYDTLEYEPNTSYILKVDHSNEELNQFLDSLNFDYYNGYGGQELFGTVWLKNNEWLERGEYDGSEWWEHKKYPEIPKELY